jgi:hypothetical protein
MKNEQLPPIEVKIKQPPVLFTKTQALIAQLAEHLGGPLVAYWNGPLGVPLRRGGAVPRARTARPA